jgi:hypothetical protein
MSLKGGKALNKVYVIWGPSLRYLKNVVARILMAAEGPTRLLRVTARDHGKNRHTCIA